MAKAVEIDLIHLLVAGVIVIVVGFCIGAGWHWLAASRKVGPPTERRPIYWNLVFFAAIGAIFSVLAMLLVDSDDRSGIALLFLGLIGGYAASIKELDLAKVEIEKLQLEKSSDPDTTKFLDGRDHPD